MPRAVDFTRQRTRTASPLKVKRKKAISSLWTMDEVNQVLTKEEAGVLKHYFSMKEGDDRQILHITESIKDAAHNLNLEISEFKTLLYSAKKKII